MQYKVKGKFNESGGMIFFMVHKFMSPQVFKPVYKSEITASKRGEFEWA